MHYLPELVIVNNVEFDHADIFRDIGEIILSFSRLLRIVPQNGLVLLNGDDPNALAAAENCPAPMRTLGLGSRCDLRIDEIASDGAVTTFRLDGARFSVPLDG